MTERGSADIALGVPAETAWNAIVSPERHRRYCRLTPKGEFAPGQTVRWVDSSGATAEASDIVEVEPPKRLVLRTRFLYAPAFASQPQHILTWDVGFEPYRETGRHLIVRKAL